MATRPTVQVYGGKAKATLAIPHVFSTPIRPDVVNDVHVSMSKNKRQPFAVSPDAGMQHSAESWGTGRAVARIPRVSGGGTHAAGQGAFGNMCRHGRMFSPTKTWRRWHRRINLQQRRYAVASAIAASGVTALELSRGHRVARVPELPLVLATEAVRAAKKTAEAKKLLQSVGAFEDVLRVDNSRHLRAGQGKSRNRRYEQRRGPLLVYAGNEEPRAFRNLMGVETVHVRHLSVLHMAPGGHLGRFVLWVQDAFEHLDEYFGDASGAPAKLKNGFTVPRAVMGNADIAAILAAPQVQAVLRPKRAMPRVKKLKKNPLTNWGAMIKLNPYAPVQKRINAKIAIERAKHKDQIAAKAQKRKAAVKKFKAAHPEIYDSLLANTHKHEPKKGKTMA